MLKVWKFYFGLACFETGLDREEKHFSYIGKFFHRNLDLFKAQCSYEAKQTSIICRLGLTKHFYIDATLSNYDISAIAYTISMVAAQRGKDSCISDLSIHSWGPGTDKLKSFINQLDDKALGYLQELHIGNCRNRSTIDLEELADNLNLASMKQRGSQGLNSLEQLHLCFMDITDEDVTVLVAGLNGNHVLKYLNLSSNSVSVAGIVALVETDCQVQHLNLSSNGIGDDGAEVVARELRNNRTLKDIDLSGNEISVTGLAALACVLQGNRLNIDLSRNKLSSHSSSLTTFKSEAGSIQDREAGQLPNYCNLVKLNLSNNKIVGDPLAIISKFKLISHLSLSHNKIGLAGAMAVVEYIANSDSYQQLELVSLCSVVELEHTFSSNMESLRRVVSTCVCLLVL